MRLLILALSVKYNYNQDWTLNGDRRNMKAAVDYIYNIPKFSKKCSLDNTKELLNRLGNPASNSKIIHVAGTNGKGSVCTFLEGILKANGYKVGTFVSPHLVTMN